MPTLEEQIAAASEALRARVYASLFQLTSEDRTETKSLFVYGTLMYPSVRSYPFLFSSECAFQSGSFLS